MSLLEVEVVVELVLQPEQVAEVQVVIDHLLVNQ
jgi:hypothetical protein